jgi:hypothetical protein
MIAHIGNGRTYGDGYGPAGEVSETLWVQITDDDGRPLFMLIVDPRGTTYQAQLEAAQVGEEGPRAVINDLSLDEEETMALMNVSPPTPQTPADL